MGDGVGSSSLLRVTVIAASLVIVVAGMKAASSILVPFLLAVFIAVIAAPLFLGLQRKGVPPAVALLVMILILALAGFVLAGAVRASLIGFSDNVAKYEHLLRERTDSIWKWLEAQGADAPDQIVSEVLSPEVAMRYAGVVTSTLGSMLGNAFLILLVTAFILFEATIMPAKVKAMPGMTDETWANLRKIVDDVRRYMSLKTFTSFLTGVAVTVMAAVLGIDYAIVMGLLAFLLNYVPNIGSFLAAIPAVLLAFIQFGPGTALTAAGGYVVVNVVVGNVIEPRLMGRGLGLSTLVVLLSMIFWGWVLGPVGMMLSVPLTMTAKIIMENSQETRWLALLLGAGPPPADEASET